MEQAQFCDVGPIKSPKSDAFPVDNIVTKSITLVKGSPPAKIPLMGLEQAACPALLPTVKSPKSCAFPVDAMVINSIEFNALSPGLFPAPNRPRVEFEQDPRMFLAVIKSPKSCAFPVDDMVTY